MPVGPCVGLLVGAPVGPCVGLPVGTPVGGSLPLREGDLVGKRVGAVGDDVGFSVEGAGVGEFVDLRSRVSSFA